MAGSVTRIRRDKADFYKDRSLVGLNLMFDENDIHHIVATVVGPASTPYEGGIFFIDIKLPDNYPYVPPAIKFVTKIWHPNIGSENGAISMNILKHNCTPAMTLKSILTLLQTLLCAPELREPHDAVVASQYLNEQSKFILKARRWTRKYATNPTPVPQQSTWTSDKRMPKMPAHLSDYTF